MSYFIDTLTRDDVGAVAELFAEDMANLRISVDHDELETMAGDILDDLNSSNPDCLCWVARLEDAPRPVGVILANFSWSLKFAGRSLWIEELFVTQDARRLGIGRALVEKLLDHAETIDISGIDLEAYQGNTPASILYRSLGFRRLGRERFYYRLGNEEFI